MNKINKSHIGEIIYQAWSHPQQGRWIIDAGIESAILVKEDGQELLVLEDEESDKISKWNKEGRTFVSPTEKECREWLSNKILNQSL